MVSPQPGRVGRLPGERDAKVGPEEEGWGREFQAEETACTETGRQEKARNTWGPTAGN